MAITSPVAGLVSPIKEVIKGLSAEPTALLSVQRLYNELRANSAVTTSNGENIYFGSSGVFDYTDVPNMIGYTDSTEVILSTWFDQTPSANNIVASGGNSNIAPGLSLDPNSLSGLGGYPAPYLNALTTNPSFTDDLTFVCLYRSNFAGPALTTTTWRSVAAGSACWLDGRVGTGNNDFYLGLSGNKLLVGTGVSGGSDTGLISTANSVTTLPALVVVRRRASDGYVEIRINRFFDSSATLSVGTLTLPSTLSLLPNSYVAEMWIFGNYLSDADVLFLEGSIFARYDYPT